MVYVLKWISFLAEQNYILVTFGSLPHFLQENRPNSFHAELINLLYVDFGTPFLFLRLLNYGMSIVIFKCIKLRSVKLNCLM